jgi:hypothetical protein
MSSAAPIFPCQRAIAARGTRVHANVNIAESVNTDAKLHRQKKASQEARFAEGIVSDFLRIGVLVAHDDVVE